MTLALDRIRLDGGRAETTYRSGEARLLSRSQITRPHGNVNTSSAKSSMSPTLPSSGRHSRCVAGRSRSSSHKARPNGGTKNVIAPYAHPAFPLESMSRATRRDNHATPRT